MKSQSFSQDIVLHYCTLPSSFQLPFIEVEKESLEGLNIRANLVKKHAKRDIREYI